VPELAVGVGHALTHGPDSRPGQAPLGWRAIGSI
jgi:hypothetical protein